MKIDSTTRNKMKEDLTTVVNYYFPHGKPSELSIGNMHTLWFKVFCNRKYEYNNGNVIKIDGKRLMELDFDFTLYPCDSNDNTLQTALISIFKEMGISVLKL